MAALNPSYQYSWTLENSSITIEAFERCGKLPTELTRHHWVSARRSLQLLLVDWSNRGVNLWKVMGPTAINLQQGVATYPINTQAITMLDVWYSQVGAGPNGSDIDRIMLPIGRDDYAEYPNKLAQGIPSVYWHNKQSPVSQLTIYQAPLLAAPAYVLKTYWLSRMMDANQAGGETPDVPYLFLEALCADLALWLSKKPTLVGRLPPDLKQELKADAAIAWERAASTNREDVPITIRPNLSVYWRD